MTKVGGVLRNRGYHKKQLMAMYYGICIPLRLFGAWLVWKYSSEETWMLWVLLAVGVWGFIANMRGMLRSEMTWWLRELHLFVSIAVACVALFVLSGWLSTEFGRNILTTLLLVDVGAGLLWSVSSRPFA